ncbi:MAG: cache domain-containing protein, partial [Desulfocapsaceae bacterium]|nr:cache domain-containing protein [Desulfocapsaceae bacterium]
MTRKKQFYSLRSRLTLMVVTVVIFPMLLATLSAFFSQKEQINRSLTRELNASLSACILYYQNLQGKLEMMTLATANDNTCKTTLRLGVLPQLQKQLKSLAQNYRMDFLLATDLSGKVVALYPPATDSDIDLNQHPLISRALQGNEITTTLQEHVPLLIRATTTPTEDDKQKTTLLLESAMPIKIRNTQIGTILAGIRLSNNNELMQTMQQASGADRTALVMNSEIVAASYQPVNLVKNNLLDTLNSLQSPVPESLAIVTCPLDKKQKVFKWSNIIGINKEPVAALITILDYDR